VRTGHEQAALGVGAAPGRQVAAADRGRPGDEVIPRIAQLVQAPDAGGVRVREVPGYRHEMTPFGGIKDSGLGYKEGVREAMNSFGNTKTYSLPW
jgi:acyl-CoA reductase-like NAD-dependent aldehyde dehydrogenase